MMMRNKVTMMTSSSPRKEFSDAKKRGRTKTLRTLFVCAFVLRCFLSQQRPAKKTKRDDKKKIILVISCLLEHKTSGTENGSHGGAVRRERTTIKTVQLERVRTF